ncbi:ImmA/IrrE family metallo-endopeptidase [Faecalimonas umbilicata]|nr:ImmA/IrrE family metallo-endopeptidase [Faecalimonas umbilicata]
MSRKEQMDTIEEKLKNGIKEYFTSEKYSALLKVMGKFHHYSFNNALLITSQCPHASYVTSYSTWKNNFNRIVRKGEKAIRIIAPCPYKTTNKKTGEEEDRLAFRAVSVFDISQTIQIPETDEIPFKLPELTGNVPDYDILIRAVSKSTIMPVSYENIPGGAKGFYSPTENRIVVQANMSPLQTLKTLIHETAHARLHNPIAQKARKTDQETKEIEAESIAFIVAYMLGLDTSDYSFEYIARWEGKDDMKRLNASMTIIRDTANSIFDDIQANVNPAA